MPKDRLQDSFDYMRAQILAGTLRLTDDEMNRFEAKVNAGDLSQNGALLSLDWSWKTRPSADNRAAIRAILLAHLHASQNPPLALAECRTVANQYKDSALSLLNATIQRKVEAALFRSVGAVEFTSGTAGVGDRRTIARCRRCTHDVVTEMHRLHHRVGRVLGVVLIDMQSDGDIGAARRFSARTVLEGMQDVIKKAGALRLNLYDIVIDRHQYDENLAAQRERRVPNVVPGTTRTIGALRGLFGNGVTVQHIDKPFFESFTGTDLADRLDNDGIETTVVMGYDANVCVKNTIFGRPQRVDWVPNGPARTPQEQLDYLQLHPNANQRERMYAGGQDVIDPLVPGLLDRGYTVLTSRAILASGTHALEEEYGVLAGQ